MAPRSRPPRDARWPFWLLLAAWLCANSPQAATFAVLTWLDEARHFTHQQRLTVEVASLLGGDATAKAKEAGVTQATPDHPREPIVPPGSVLKKIELGEPLDGVAVVLPRRALVHAVQASGVPAAPMREPLTEPPRV